MLKLIESTAWPPQGPVRIFQEPLRDHAYVIGADPAEGLEHGDAAAACVIDIETGLLVATFHDHCDPDLFGEQLNNLGRYYNNALIGVEINNHGHVTVLTLRKLGYPRIFRRRTIGQISDKHAPQYGWLTNKLSKPKMIDDLGAAIRDRSIDIRCEYTLAELRTYIREYGPGGTVKTHGSPHDDRTMSLAIAWQMVPYHRIFVEEEKPSDVGTWNYYYRQATEASQAQSDVKPLGFYNTRQNDRRSLPFVGTLSAV